jgi:hypothetical protein
MSPQEKRHGVTARIQTSDLSRSRGGRSTTWAIRPTFKWVTQNSIFFQKLHNKSWLPPQLQTHHKNTKVYTIKADYLYIPEADVVQHVPSRLPCWRVAVEAKPGR